MAASEQGNQTWTKATKHRDRIARDLIFIAGEQQPDLCVWGAGPCNDLDLEKLLPRFSRITLVDLDGKTLKNAIHDRGLTQHDRLDVLGDVDLAGIGQLLDRYQKKPDAGMIKEIADRAAEYCPPIQQRFGMVVSTCLLSQIFRPVVDLFSEDLESMVYLLCVLRRRHLELLVQSTAAAGTALLITDVTSSDGTPDLLAENVDLDKVLREKVVTGQHFHGLNPKAIVAEVKNNPTLQRMVKRNYVSQPWVWDARERKYLCLSFLLAVRA